MDLEVKIVHSPHQLSHGTIDFFFHQLQKYLKLSQCRKIKCGT
jgi:hypothetical protein